jgi:hypothetical protein
MTWNGWLRPSFTREVADQLAVDLAKTEGRRLAALLAWFWHFDHRGREGLTFLRHAIDRAPDERSHLQARLLTGFALVADTAGPLDVEYDAAARAWRWPTRSATTSCARSA